MAVQTKKLTKKRFEKENKAVCQMQADDQIGENHKRKERRDHLVIPESQPRQGIREGGLWIKQHAGGQQKEKKCIDRFFEQIFQVIIPKQEKVLYTTRV